HAVKRSTKVVRAHQLRLDGILRLHESKLRDFVVLIAERTNVSRGRSSEKPIASAGSGGRVPRLVR
ncbi:MAG: hypothetical protein R3282_07495, partial [Rhodothermales bacterium]|nr:hypothetical protein [Rhodothermales bacterium]